MNKSYLVNMNKSFIDPSFNRMSGLKPKDKPKIDDIMEKPFDPKNFLEFC